MQQGFMYVLIFSAQLRRLRYERYTETIKSNHKILFLNRFHLQNDALQY